MSLRFHWLLILMCMTTGCVHQVSDAPPFAKYAGKQNILFRQCEVWSVSGAKELVRGRGVYRKQILIEAEFEKPEKGRLLRILPKGEGVFVEQVNAAYTWSGALVHALGHSLPANGEHPLDFEFEWGGFSYIGRAPWEPDSTPDTRYVGRNGRKGPRDLPATKPNPVSRE